MDLQESIKETVKINWEPHKQTTIETGLFSIKEEESKRTSISKHLGKKEIKKKINEPMVTMNELLYQFYTFKHNYEKFKKENRLSIINKNKNKNKKEAKMKEMKRRCTAEQWQLSVIQIKHTMVLFNL